MIDKVVWSEGLLLTPQHFQLNDSRFETSVSTLIRESRQDNWGFFRLNLARHSLGFGKVSIDYAFGIMSDGTLFEVDGKEDPILYDVRSEDAGQIISLCLPSAIGQGIGLETEDEGIEMRYCPFVIKNVGSINSNETSLRSVSCARLNFSLLPERLLPKGSVSMELCRIRDVSPGGGVILDDDFQPPYRHIGASSHLSGELNGILNMINYRGEQISERLEGSSSVRPAELGDYLMLQLLNRGAAAIRFFLSSDRVHPAEVYWSLSAFDAEMRVFSQGEKKISESDIYNHSKQGECFTTLIEDIRQKLSLVLEEASIPLAIEKRKYGIYVSPIADVKLVRLSSFILMATADTESSKLLNDLPLRLKVGTVETIRNRVNLHIPGFHLQPLLSAPRQIPSSIEHCYFKIELSEEDKAELEHSGGFGIHVSGDFKNLSLHMWAVRNG